MSGDSVPGLPRQLKNIHRCIYYSEKINSKPVQHPLVTSLFKNSVYALKEQKKVSHYIGKEEWPCDLHTKRDNMLRTTVLGNELNEN